MRRLLLLALSAGLLLHGAAADAAALAAVRNPDGSDALLLEGNIAPGDAKRLDALVSAITDVGRPAPTLQLNSLGGTFGETLRIIDVVQRRRLGTLVPNGARCASACFTIFTEELKAEQILHGLDGGTA
jgi:hypothetical protein